MPDPADVEAEDGLDALDNRIHALLRERDQLRNELHQLQAVAAANRVRLAVQGGRIPGVDDVWDGPD